MSTLPNDQDGTQSDSRALLATVATLTLATSSALLWHTRRSASARADNNKAGSSSSGAAAQSMLSSFASWCSRTTPSSASTSEAVTEHPIEAIDHDSASKVAGPSNKNARSKDRRRRNKDLTAKDMRKVKELLKPTRSAGPTTPTVLDDTFEVASPLSNPRARMRSTSIHAGTSTDVTPVQTPPKEDPLCSSLGRAEPVRHRAALPEFDMLAPENADADAQSSVESSSVASSTLLAPPSVSSLSSPPRSVSRVSASTSTSAWDSAWDRDGLAASPPTATSDIHTRAVSPTPRFLAACAAPGSSSRSDSRSPGPALSSQTQLAALKGALEASRLREEKLRSDTERGSKERDALRWQWREESNAWRRREAELQSHIHYLTHSLHVSAGQLAAAAPHPPAFSPLSPMSPPFSPYGQLQMPVPASAYAPPPLAALELARSFPPPPSSVGSGSAGGSPDRGRRRGRDGSESPELKPEEEEELELSDEVADAILKRPDSIKRVRRKLSNTSAGSDGERPKLEALRFPSIESWGNTWVEAQPEDTQ